MSTTILNYAFDRQDPANPDGSQPLSFSGTSVVDGPGRTTLGTFPNALDFGARGKAKLDLSSIRPDFRQFCFQFIFRIDDQVTARQNLFESNFLPIAVFAMPGDSANTFVLRSTLETIEHGWSGADSAFRSRKLRTDRWYVVTVAYDFDTLALFITDTAGNDLISKVHAFPKGTVKRGPKKELYFGTWTNGRRDQFHGKMAAFKWFNQIPEAIEQELDSRRSHAEWFITYKFESIKKTLNTGERTRSIQFRPAIGAHIQFYEHCAIMYHGSLGAAFEMHGKIFTYYKNWNKALDLGYLVSDEIDTTKPGGRRSVFSKGEIIWSRNRAIAILDQIYLEYENIGGSATLGFPTTIQRRLGPGVEQVFEGGRMYYRNNAPKAHEVHGAILDKLLSLGGVMRWGYPVTNELDFLKEGNPIGKFSQFEQCTIFYNGAVGAHEVHGAIRQRYMAMGGPAGELGWPTSDEKDIPGVAGFGKANTFQNGSVLCYGSLSTTYVALPFKLWVGRVDTKESEGVGMGQNDVYFNHIGVHEKGTWLYKARYPQRGHYREGNVKTVNITVPHLITPNDLSLKYTFAVKVSDMDPRGNPDDHLGSYSKELNAANAWGFRENFGSYRVSFRKVKSMTWAVKPQIDLSLLSETQKWWSTGNPSTSRVSWRQCAAAFRDIDSELEWHDVEDWAQKAFYHLVVKGIASGGNCFGFSTENIYARKGNSLFNMPVNRYKNWEFLRQEINIKQAYQVGAGPIWWFIGQFLSGNTHDPVDVFRRSREAYRRGDNPVLCVSQNYDFSGAPHCIMPIAWDSSSKPWKITILDPNLPTRTATMTINPDENSFEYQGAKFYKGAEWTGGRLQYVPFSLLSSPPRTPIWDAVLLLLSGTIIILADSSETTSITDGLGNDLDASGNRAKQVLQDGNRPEEYFYGFQGFDRAASIKPQQFLIRREDGIARSVSPVNDIANLPILEVVKDRRFRKLSVALKRNARVRRLIAGKSVKQVLNNPLLRSRIPGGIVKDMEAMAAHNSNRNFVHKIKNVRPGDMDVVMKHGLNQIRIEAPMTHNEEHEIRVNDFGSHTNQIQLVSERAKQVRISIRNKIGVAGDFIELELRDIPIGTDAPLEMNIRPGIGGLDLVGPMVQTSIPVLVRSRIEGKSISREFNVSVNNGVRIKPASVLTENELTISTIGQLFGPILSSIKLK